jgi:hypothetical protein
MDHMLSEDRAAATPADSETALSANGSLGSTGTPAEADLNIGQQWARNCLDLIATRDLPAERQRFFQEIAKFAERTGCAAVTDHEINLWGYGTAKVQFADNDGNWWISLAQLVEPTGVPWSLLSRMYWNDVEDNYSDVEELSWLVDDSDPEDREICRLEMVGPSFAIRAMLSGPWGKEFSDALFPTFRRALVESGMADRLGPVLKQNPDGTFEQTDMTFGEFMAQGEPLPTHEAARAQAFQGPVAP